MDAEELRQYLEPTRLIDSTHAAVIEQARRLTAGCASDRERLERIYYFVRDMPYDILASFRYLAQGRKFPVPGIFGVDQLNPICPGSDVEAAGIVEVEERRPGIVQQGEDPQLAVGSGKVEIGHATSEQRVSLAEVVVDVEAGHHSGEALARLVHAQQLGHGVARRLVAIVDAHERDLRHRVAQHAGSNRVTLGMVGIQEAFRRCPVDHLG